jgi:hypothetical protein
VYDGTESDAHHRSTTSCSMQYVTQLVHKNPLEQARAELCQAQAQLGFPAEAELILMLSFMMVGGCLPSSQINLRLLEETYNWYTTSLADSKLKRSSSIEVVSTEFIFY